MKGNKTLSIGQYKTFTGFGNYTHNALTAQVISTTPSILNISEAMVNDETQLPLDATSSLWSGNKIIPISENDCYDIRISFNVNAKTSSPTRLKYILDIGGTGSITNNIFESFLSVERTPPYVEGFTFPIYCKSTFFANGGQIFLSTDTGTIDITSPKILIIRTHKGY
jgi:hypothetical protein